MLCSNFERSDPLDHFRVRGCQLPYSIWRRDLKNVSGLEVDLDLECDMGFGSVIFDLDLQTHYLTGFRLYAMYL